MGLSYDEAVAMLPDREKVHTFRQGGLGLLGADWPREKILAAIKEHLDTLNETEGVSKRMGHGLVLVDDTGPLFIETRKANE